MDTPRVSVGAIQRFVELLWRSGDVREIRVPKHNKYGHTASGYFDSPEALTEAAVKWDGRANVYVSLNPVAPALLARANNRILDKAEHTTADTDILRRDWLFIDVDPDRPSGISGSESEREAALAVLDNCTSYLNAQTWSTPVTALSGNGYYALYKIDLPNDAESLALITTVLVALSERFNTDAAHIDTAVCNASRIIGLVGTKKMKGDSMPERPHRYSELLSVPEQISTVTEAQLRAIGPQAEGARDQVLAAPKSSTAGRLTDTLDAARIEYREQPPDVNGVTWYHVRRCPFHEDGRDFECGVGQKLPDGPYAGHGFHPECFDKGWQEWKLALGLGRFGPTPRLLAAPQTPSRRPTDFARTDTGNAELFACFYGDRLRFDHRRRRWLIWEGHHWGEDTDGSVVRLAMEAVRQRYLAALALDNLVYSSGTYRTLTSFLGMLAAIAAA